MVATFSGADFLTYNLTSRGESIVSKEREIIKFSFKTSSGNGLMFYTGGLN